jgi:four helix bundle protein
MQPYERFEAWRKSDDLAVAVWQATKRWPKSEMFGLTSQARRAAFSAPANIVEGSSRRGTREFRHYVGISFASLTELSYTLLFARRVGLLTTPEWQRLEDLRTSASKLTWLVYAALKRRLERSSRSS